MDTISCFLESCCLMQGETKASVLYAVYAKWADENGEYSFTRSVVHGDTFKKTITVELSGLNGYQDTDGRISAE